MLPRGGVVGWKLTRQQEEASEAGVDATRPARIPTSTVMENLMIRDLEKLMISGVVLTFDGV
jgi:hypothetical protein